MLLILADSAASASQNSTTIYYVVGSVVLVLGVISGAIRYYNKQRERWTLEGQQRAEQSQAVKHNSDKLEENSNVIAALTRELHDFMVSIRSELTLHDGRISRLERWRDVHGHGQPGTGENKKQQ